MPDTRLYGLKGSAMVIATTSHCIMLDAGLKPPRSSSSFYSSGHHQKLASSALPGSTSIISAMEFISAPQFPPSFVYICPTTDSRDASPQPGSCQLAGQLDCERASSSNLPKQNTPASPAASINTRMDRSPAPSLDSIVPIDETAIFHVGDDISPFNDAVMSPVAPMSLQEIRKSELDSIEKISWQDDRSYQQSSRGKSTKSRYRGYTVPGSSVDFGALNQKSKAEVGISAESSKHHAGNEDAHKPTAQEWTADIDCVSDIFGSMVADGDRGGVHL